MPIEPQLLSGNSESMRCREFNTCSPGLTSNATSSSNKHRAVEGSGTVWPPHRDSGCTTTTLSDAWDYSLCLTLYPSQPSMIFVLNFTAIPTSKRWKQFVLILSSSSHCGLSTALLMPHTNIYDPLWMVPPELV